MVNAAVSNARLTPVWKGAFVDNPPGTPDTGDPVTEPFGSGNHITRLSTTRSGDMLRVQATITVSGWASNNAGQRMYAQVRLSSNIANPSLSNPISGGYRSSNGTISLDVTIPIANYALDGLFGIFVEGSLYASGKTPSTAAPLARYGTINTTAFVNRTPEPPTLTGISSGASITYGAGASSTFDVSWTLGADADRLTSETQPGFNGPSNMDDYAGYQFQIRRAPSTQNPNPDWSVNLGDLQVAGELIGAWDRRRVTLIADPNYVSSADTLKARLSPGAWQVRARTFDQSGRVSSASRRDPSNPANIIPGSVSGWSNVITIYVIAPFLPPSLVRPIGNQAVTLNSDNTLDLEWLFRDPRPTGGTQAKRILRARPADQDPVAVITNLSSRPSVEAGADSILYGWRPNDATLTVTQNTTAPNATFSGVANAWVRRVATGAQTAATYIVDAIGHGVNARPSVTPGKTYNQTVYVYSPAYTGSLTARLRVEWLNSSATVIGSMALGTVTAINGGSGTMIANGTRVAFTGTAPANAVTARVSLALTVPASSNTSTTIAYVDAAMMIEGSTPVDYFDGNSVGASWVGTQNLSESTMPLWFDLIPVGSQTSAVQKYKYTNGTTITFVPGLRYEWQARTVSTPGNFDSGWSDSEFFFIVPQAGSGTEYPDSDVTFPDPGLGCGTHRAFLYKRGGMIPLGEITEFSFIQWARERDEISQARVVIPIHEDTDRECKALLTNARSWLHELVIFRDNGTGMKRVWEGPATRITYETDQVEIAAHDVMVYVYRRIMRQGYNDSYRVQGRTYNAGGGVANPGVIVSQPLASTLRSERIIQNALAYDDPNVLAYLTVRSASDDAKQSRIVPDYSRGAWQHIDDLAAKSGLDYTTVGRRIITWDTHNQLGLLPEMRDGDFDSPPIVTEYGMQAANVYAVTNNAGVYGLAEREDANIEEYGSIEMVNSAWGEEEEGGSDMTLTAEARAELEETLVDQAERNIGARWPVPVVVRIPDNSRLSPDVQVGINEWVPGVHVPLRSTSTLREVSQMQKLDRLTVQEDERGERVLVTLSPAPRNRGDDPDAGGGEV